MALNGNTVRLKAEFKTFAGVYADPTNITLKIYDCHKYQVGTTISITTADKTALGVYEYDYTIPLGYEELTYEFSGLLEDTVILGRSTIDCDWT